MTAEGMLRSLLEILDKAGYVLVYFFVSVIDEEKSFITLTTGCPVRDGCPRQRPQRDDQQVQQEPL